MLTAIGGIVILSVAAVLVYATTRPGGFRIERAISIKAPPERIASFIQDFRRWRLWSPYEKLDPAMARTLGGATSGAGAVYAWEGRGKAGAGRMEIVETAGPARTTIKLDFVKPFEGHNIAEFTILPEDDGMRVTWVMHGPAPYVAKVMGIFIDMDRMIGKDFDVGLVNLKAVAEGGEASVAQPSTASATVGAG